MCVYRVCMFCLLVLNGGETRVAPDTATDPWTNMIFFTVTSLECQIKSVLPFISFHVTLRLAIKNKTKHKHCSQLQFQLSWEHSHQATMVESYGGH